MQLRKYLESPDESQVYDASIEQHHRVVEVTRCCTREYIYLVDRAASAGIHRSIVGG